MDDQAFSGTYPQSLFGVRLRLPGKAVAGNGFQDIVREQDQAAQDSILPGTPRS